MKYPDEHFEIVKDLLGGKFILSQENEYNIVAKNYEFYQEFFTKSFKYTLMMTTEYVYLSSLSTKETFSKNMMLVLSVLVDYLNSQGRDLYEDLYKNYTISELESIIKNSSYFATCRKIVIHDLIKKDCQRRNIVKYNANYETFAFTSAINVFLEKARTIATKNENETHDIQNSIIENF